VVYDLEITPNRPDLNSVIGIAREISAVTGNPLKPGRDAFHRVRDFAGREWDAVERVPTKFGEGQI
jgi:phenylalanyl-tRNA synthetase beta subunit